MLLYGKPLKCLGCVIALLYSLAMLSAGTCFADEANERAFLEKLFQGSVPQPETLWITASVRPKVESVLNQRFKGPRIKYWRENDRSIWILNDMAKETPVCAAIVVSQKKIQRLEILSAEGRWGSLVKNENFTMQFEHAAFDETNGLTISVDGISGATISVNTVSRLARLALVLDSIQRGQ